MCIRISNATTDPDVSHDILTCPPLAPRGGWERLIRSVRRQLSHLTVDPQIAPVKPDVLRTMLAGAQKIINVRPLTPIRSSPDHCDAITPSSRIDNPSVKPTNPIGALPNCENLLINFRQVQDRVDMFWRKWMQVYLHYLQKCHSQRMTHKNFEIGNLVLLCNQPTVRGKYPLAHIVEVLLDFKGVVQHVRVMTANANKLNVDLRCTHTILEGDTTKIAALEFPAINPVSEQFHMPNLQPTT